MRSLIGFKRLLLPRNLTLLANVFSFFNMTEPDLIAPKTTKKEPVLECTGVFIPVEIWTSTELSWLEKCLAGEINAVGGHRGACKLSNERLGNIMGMTTGSVAVAISKLRGMGIVEDRGTKFKRSLKTNFETLAITKVDDETTLVMAKETLANTKVTLAITNHHIDKNLGDQLERSAAAIPSKSRRIIYDSPEHQQARALFIQAYNETHTDEYRMVPVKDDKFLAGLLAQGEHPESIGNLAALVFRNRDYKKRFWSGRVVTIHQFVTHYQELKHENPLPAASTPKADEGGEDWQNNKNFENPLPAVGTPKADEVENAKDFVF